jgi:hypothetical protein
VFKKYIVITIVVSVIAGMTMYFICKYARGESDIERDRKYNEAVNEANDWKSKFLFTQFEVKEIAESLRVVKRQRDSNLANANHYRDSAEILRKKIESFVKPAPADSTNPKWMHLYQLSAAENEERKKENLSLRSVIKNDSAEIKFRITEVDRWKASSFKADTTINSLKESLELERHKYDCRIILWKCPSRKVSALAGSAITLLAIGYIETQKHDSPNSKSATNRVVPIGIAKF